MDDMSTLWDGDRLRARVETWEPKPGQQIGLGQSTGLVVRVYDHGPADGRTDKGTLRFDSEVAHGTAGIFGGSDEAREYADRIEQALLVLEQWREQVQHERREGLDAAQGERFRDHDKAKAEAAEANARAKKAQQEIRQLRDEAAAPVVTLECPLRGEGYRVILAPSLTDGTHEEAEGRTLTNTIPDPRPQTASRRRHGPAVIKPAATAIDEAIEGMEAAKPKRKGKGKKAPPRAEAKPKLPEHVPDTSGVPLRVGSRVEIPGLEIEQGRVTAILRQDPDGAFVVEVEDDEGKPRTVTSAECCKIEGRESDDPGWPE